MKIEMSEQEMIRIISWYDNLEPNETAEEDFLPDALLAKKFIEASGDKRSLEIHDSYIRELKNENRNWK